MTNTNILSGGEGPDSVWAHFQDQEDEYLMDVPLV